MGSDFQVSVRGKIEDHNLVSRFVFYLHNQRQICVVSYVSIETNLLIQLCIIHVMNQVTDLTLPKYEGEVKSLGVALDMMKKKAQDTIIVYKHSQNKHEDPNNPAKNSYDPGVSILCAIFYCIFKSFLRELACISKSAISCMKKNVSCRLEMAYARINSCRSSYTPYYI